MRIIDADNLIKDVHEEWDPVLIWDETGDATACEIERLIDAQPTVDLWHYPSKGEYPKEGEWVLVVAKNASAVPTPGKWVMQYFAKSDNYLRSDNYFANKIYSIYAPSVACWQYIIPPKKEEKEL